MRHVRQPEGSKLCGQCCVAMIAGITLNAAIELIGHSRGTRPSELKLALEKRGFRVAGRLLRVRKGWWRMPHLCIVKMLPPLSIRSKRSHWLVFCGDRFFDPACGPDQISSGRLSSYLEVRRERKSNGRQ